MSQQIPERASAVVIGGGVVGSSVAYHLAKLGWSDVLLLERKQFACGTTWHAAGLVGIARTTESLAKLAHYSMSLLPEIEKETGQSTGFRQVGSVSIAHSEARFEELKRLAAMNNGFGVTRIEVVTPEEIRSLCPIVRTDDLLGGTWLAEDGIASPVDVTAAYVKGARMHGALCIEGITVTAIHRNGRKVSAVSTDHGDVRCDFVVNCGGLWGREIGRMAGVNIPVQACEHYYAHTEKLEGLPRELPVLRDHDKCAYYREDAGSLLVGAFEEHAVPLSMDAIPNDFAFDELPGHAEEQLMPVLEDAMKRVPLLQEAGWRSFFCGPESFTPDNQFHLGAAPELDNFFVACGLNSVGIQSSGGVGKVLAEWMDKGYPPMDLWGNDIRRMHTFQGTERYLRERVCETLGLLYANHYPFRQYQSARNLRLSPVHEAMRRHNACFGEAAGWERPNWYAPEGVKPEYQYGFDKQPWFQYWAQEHRAAREQLALFDQSSFSKYLVQGRDAVSALQRISSADVDVEPGRVVYTHWLNERGGIEADLTVTRLDERVFWVVSGAAVSGRDLDHLRRHIPEDVHCTYTDVTSGWAVLGIMGPQSRALLEALCGEAVPDEALRFGHARTLEIGYSKVLVLRVSYVGELGYELYVEADQASHVMDEVMREGAAFQLQLAGMHALDSCRVEKKFVHFGHDVSDEDTPLQAGMGFVCNFDKKIPFIGRDALLAQRESGAPRTKLLAQFLLSDPELMLYHHEPIMRDGKIVGHLSSGSYGHALGASVGLGYVYCEDGVDRSFIESGSFAIDVGGEHIPCRASLRAMYDPGGKKMRAS